ncbi:methyltransferase domain-containing protein [Desulfobulbus rhabdoformis]|uniref:methyltransferase domain-containing protein n=1 Tax=Desulfobulbus rhabdoformis TaxID=34032 RepID=UPI00196625D5|nr:methyltransferase domain-containing protein [Desulfobulbus rhabdoformis]MBM9616861.1 methyltransferase domain-containing protein [Desulfobulbus rhabdoformis]
MSSLSFVDDMADIQRLVAQCHDQAVRRGSVLEIMQPQTGEKFLEVGCGGGFYAYEVARCVGPTGRMCAIDYSADQIATAERNCVDMEWVECRVGEASELPYENDTFDTVYGIQVFEYIEQLDAALREVRRVLRPGGRCFILSTDWRTAVWHSHHEKRMQRILSAWETHSSTLDLPALLGVKLRNVGLVPLRQTPMSFLNRSYHRNSFSYWAARVIRSFVEGKHEIGSEEAEAWLNEFELLEQQQAYFFCLTSVLTEAIKNVR